MDLHCLPRPICLKTQGHYSMLASQTHKSKGNLPTLILLLNAWFYGIEIYTRQDFYLKLSELHNILAFYMSEYMPRHEKIGLLHMRKQKCRLVLRLPHN